MPSLLRICVALLVLAASIAGTSAQTGGSNVIVVTIDGLRWQEFFGGAQREYFKRGTSGSPGPAEQRFWRDSPGARRTALMPFVWSVVAVKGQIFGDDSAGSRAGVTNGLWFSYPGYSEMFAGIADARIDSNNKIPNPNVTVLEWLNKRPGFADRVAAFGSWDVLPSILNAERSGIPVGTGWQPVLRPETDRDRAVNQLAADLPRYWEYGPFDAPIVYAALENLRTQRPRVLYVMLGEGDEWAHEGKYDLYLDATKRADAFIQRIWDVAQSMDGYAGRTSLILTTDHGRGDTLKDWSDHGRDVPAAERTWIAVMGPAVPALGVRKDLRVNTSQIAATIAALVGEDFRAVSPQAAAPLPTGK
jgi:hypothetical protein